MTTPKPEELKALKACPNPWCDATMMPLATHGASGWRFACACGVRTPACPNRMVAFDTWNTRPEPASVPAEMREMIEWLDMQIVRLDGASIWDDNRRNKYIRIRALLAVVPLVEVK